jgi:transposase
MHERRLVGIDLAVASAHTAQVLRADGTKVCRRSCWPRLDSLQELERAALAGASDSTRLEVVMEATGPAWRPIAVYFVRRGHLVYRVSSARAHDLRRFLSRHAKSNSIDALTLAMLPIVGPQGLLPLELGSHEQAALDRRVRVCDRLTRLCTVHKTRLKDLVRQLLPLSPLAGDLTNADLAVLLETGADPHHLARLGKARLITRASRGHLGAVRAQHWLDAAGEAIRLFQDHPAVAIQELAEEVIYEGHPTCQAVVSLQFSAAGADPKGLARSLPGIGEVGAPNLVAAIGRPGRFSHGKQVRSSVA